MIPQVVGKTIWDELPDANVDTQKLEHLFESRAKDLMTKVRILTIPYIPHITPNWSKVLEIQRL